MSGARPSGTGSRASTEPCGLGPPGFDPARYADTQAALIDELADTLCAAGNAFTGYAQQFGEIGSAGHGKRDVALEYARSCFEQYYRLRPEARP